MDLLRQIKALGRLETDAEVLVPSDEI